MDKAANLHGAIGPDEHMPTTGVSGVEAAVSYLKKHDLFSPQYEQKAEMSPDKDKFILNRRFVEQASLDGRYSKSFLFITWFLLVLVHIENVLSTRTRKLHVIKFLQDDDGCFDVERAIGYESPVDFMEDRNPFELKFSVASTELELSFTATENKLQL